MKHAVMTETGTMYVDGYPIGCLMVHRSISSERGEYSVSWTFLVIAYRDDFFQACAFAQEIEPGVARLMAELRTLCGGNE